MSQSPQATPGQTPSSELANVEAKVRPSVIWVTTFDSKGNLLRTESGFFISADGRFVSSAHAIEGGVNAVAKTADGGIYNVSGVLTVSKSADLAVLKADVKPQKLLRFLDGTKTGELSRGAKVAVIGSSLAGNEGTAREATITAHSSDRLEIAGATAPGSVGSPMVNENGDVVGIITSSGEKTIARPVAELHSVLSRVKPDTEAPGTSGPNKPDTAGDAKAAIALCACAVVSARPISARAVGDRTFSIDVRSAGKRYGRTGRHVHGKSWTSTSPRQKRFGNGSLLPARDGKRRSQ